MQAFKSSDWQAVEKTYELEVYPRHFVEAQVSCTQTVTLQGVLVLETDNGETEIKVPLMSGNQFRFKETVSGFVRLIFQAEVPFGLRLIDRPKQDGEPLTHENPPPPPLPGADNLVARIQRIMRDQANASRPPRLDPEDMPLARRYMVADDDEDFEEEMLAKAQKARKDALSAPPDPSPASQGEVKRPDTSQGREKPQAELDAASPPAATAKKEPNPPAPKRD